MTHLGITGTKKGITEAQFEKLEEFILIEDWVTHLHQGDCVGADNQITLMYQDLQPSVKIICHPPIRTKYQAFGPYDEIREPKDYLVRDQDNVNESDFLLATPDGPERIRSGTWTTVRYARKKGIPITIIMPDGVVINET